MGHSDGLCCMYFDSEMDIEKATNCLFDAKTNYVSACNSLETLLIHESVHEKAGIILAGLIEKKNVEVRADERAIKFIKGAIPSNDKDYKTEFLDYKLAVKTVSNVYEAIEHINEYSSHHTDSIITENDVILLFITKFMKTTANIFLKNVNSAGVYLNASTRFADGYRYGKYFDLLINFLRFWSRSWNFN